MTVLLKAGRHRRRAEESCVAGSQRPRDRTMDDVPTYLYTCPARRPIREACLAPKQAARPPIRVSWTIVLLQQHPWHHQSVQYH